MPEKTALSRKPRKSRPASFTLIELLTVMAIISVLMALTFAAISALWSRANRSRASSEIQAMSAALEGYKTDNGIYPPSDGTVLLTNTYAAYDGTSVAYQTNSQLLYQALSGQTNYADTHVSGVKTYMTFKTIQLGNFAAAAGTTGTNATYIRDPWGYSYGYSTGPSPASTTNSPYAGSGFIDLWSTGGLLVSKVNTNAWISSWAQ
jgi:prepilin-type N-terminal cleavage/methylation domain-containing protein